MSKEDFLKVWKDSSREDILQQFYYDYSALEKAYKHINRALEILKEHKQDLDYEPWTIYKVVGHILFDLVIVLESSDSNE